MTTFHNKLENIEKLLESHRSKRKGKDALDEICELSGRWVQRSVIIYDALKQDPFDWIGHNPRFKKIFKKYGQSKGYKKHKFKEVYLGNFSTAANQILRLNAYKEFITGISEFFEIDPSCFIQGDTAENGNEFIKKIVNGSLGKELGLIPRYLHRFQQEAEKLNFSPTNIDKSLVALLQFLKFLKTLGDAFELDETYIDQYLTKLIEAVNSNRIENLKPILYEIKHQNIKLPPVSPVKKDFIGRDKYLDQMISYLKPNHGHPDRQKLLWIHGMPGVGKTQLVKKYINLYSEAYSDYNWLDIFSLENVETQTEEFLLNQIRETKGWLLIFDNVSEYKEIENYVSLKAKGTLIVISTLPNCPDYFSPLEIKPFSYIEAIALLNNSLPEDMTTILKDLENEADDYRCFPESLKKEPPIELSHQLGCLPLALCQAIEYIKDCSCTVEQYKNLFSFKRQKLWEVEISPIDSKSTVLTALKSAIGESGSEQSDLESSANDLMFLCSFFYHKNIDLNLIKTVSHYLPLKLNNDLEDEINFNNMKKSLKRDFLVEFQGSEIEIHPLIQHIIHDQLNDHLWTKWLLASLNCIDGMIGHYFRHKGYDKENDKGSATIISLMNHFTMIIDNLYKYYISKSFSTLGIMTSNTQMGNLRSMVGKPEYYHHIYWELTQAISRLKDQFPKTKWDGIQASRVANFEFRRAISYYEHGDLNSFRYIVCEYITSTKKELQKIGWQESSPDDSLDTLPPIAGMKIFWLAKFMACVPEKHKDALRFAKIALTIIKYNFGIHHRKTQEFENIVKSFKSDLKNLV